MGMEATSSPSEGITGKFMGVKPGGDEYSDKMKGGKIAIFLHSLKLLHKAFQVSYAHHPPIGHQYQAQALSTQQLKPPSLLLSP